MNDLTSNTKGHLRNKAESKSKSFTTKTMVTIGLLSALSYALMLLESPAYIGFLRLELSDIPAIIGAFQFGPLSGVIIELLKNVIKALTATKTVFVGELANLIVSVAYVVPAAIIYRKLQSKYKSLIAFSTATLSMMIAGILINYFVTVPLYASIYGGMDNVLAAATAMLPVIKDKFTLIIYGITPFNFVKGIFMGVIGHYTYKIFKSALGNR